MNMIGSMAWKNIWRNKLRSLVVVMAIASGLTGGVFSAAVIQGTSDQRIREAVSRETSHLQIHNPGYVENNEIRCYIGSELPGLEHLLDTMREVGAWSPRIKFIAMAASASAGTGVMVNGIDPAKEKAVTGIHALIADTSGNWFSGCKGIPAVIGNALAKKLGVRLHSKFVLTFQDMQGSLTGGAFRICGIYRTSNSVFDEMNIYVQRSDIAGLVGSGDSLCHEIAVRLNDPESVTRIENTLKSRFPGLLVQNWKEVDPLLGMLSDFMDLWLYLFMGIILLALGFGIINTMLMAILERTRELGMLAAIGMNRLRLFTLIMLESVFLSLTGGAIGMALGSALTYYTGRTGIDLGIFAEGFEKIGYNPILYPSLDPLFFINLTIMVVMTGILASVYPARQALRLRPAEAIRNE